ncbi:hypothetical protein Y032_0224g2705 [Ancylostoma ceylanicum]|uniref:LIM zinc-binding domain-containing protein n=1 Tax=Ancylostoma ceylanicum TaxID=53326 RepID=A0A016SI77_9BILA|nr:hypothetical protein Y032_0224g2705 [Ancylostoma ceylanicum]
MINVSSPRVDVGGASHQMRVFHVACFKCKKCDTKLAGSSFYNIDNDPICDKCYQVSEDQPHPSSPATLRISTSLRILSTTPLVLHMQVYAITVLVVMCVPPGS